MVAGRYERRLESLAREVEEARNELLAAQRALGEAGDAARLLADLLRDPATRVVVLRGTGPAAGAQGRVVWHERAGGYLLVTNLPPPGPGRTYELSRAARRLRSSCGAADGAAQQAGRARTAPSMRRGTSRPAGPPPTQRRSSTTTRPRSTVVTGQPSTDQPSHGE